MKNIMKLFLLMILLFLLSSCSMSENKKLIKIVSDKSITSITDSVYTEGTNPIMIVAKSKTIISSKEKEEIIKDLDNKLDDLFKSIEK